MSGDDEAALLAEQVDYYGARAPEYDRWFQRLGRYDRGEAATARWLAEIEEVRLALAGMPLDGGDVLELASGTGIWTEQLVDRAGYLTAVDASAEMIAENRRKLAGRTRSVSYIQADLFEWQPEHAYDAVVFCFWISHVPDARLDEFLQGVAAMLRPGGFVFFLDGRRDPTSTAADSVLPEQGEVMTRRLDDGREFRVIKNFWPAEEVAARCFSAGLEVDVLETATYFQYGIGTRISLPGEPRQG